MNQNVAQALETKATGLYEKIASNEPLSNIVMAFLGRMVLTCAKEGKQVAGVQCGPVTENGGEFRFRVTYNRVHNGGIGVWQAQSGLAQHVEAKSRHLALCFDANPGLIKTFTHLVETVDGFCKRKQISFKDFKIKKAFITPDNVFVLRSGTETLDRWGR